MCAAAVVMAAALAACPSPRRPEERLLPASADISRAYERPRDPFRDPLPPGATTRDEIRIGYLLFTETKQFCGPMVGSELSCSNCHLNAGQRKGGLPLVGVSMAYPAPNLRTGRAISLEERIVSCLLRSVDAANGEIPLGRTPHENAVDYAFPSPKSYEVRAIAAYLAWLSEGVGPPEMRSHDGIPRDRLIPIDRLDPVKGERLYANKCMECHGQDGQGVHIGRLKPGPLWGDGSWNDGAGFARVYTLAGFLRRAMPYSSPGKLKDDEAQHIAAFLLSKPRPIFPEKQHDYPGTKPPVDAVYYGPTNPFRVPAGTD